LVRPETGALRDFNSLYVRLGSKSAVLWSSTRFPLRPKTRHLQTTPIQNAATNDFCLLGREVDRRSWSRPPSRGRQRAQRHRAVEVGVGSAPGADEEAGGRRDEGCTEADSMQRSKTAGHSMSWSARSRNDSEIVSPSDLAVFRLMTSANLVGCWTGRSEGLAPFKILST
jgi:hypothetical protein